jgi:hypothetical protein
MQDRMKAGPFSKVRSVYVTGGSEQSQSQLQDVQLVGAETPSLRSVLVLLVQR